VATHIGTRDVETKLYPRSAHLIAADLDRDAVAEDVATFVDRVAKTKTPTSSVQSLPVEP
jgi:alpha-beta hydrolase superfamily lysophospholipase